MSKKMKQGISLFLTIIMLTTMSSISVYATNTDSSAQMPAQPSSLEQILEEFHTKSFQISQQEQATASSSQHTVPGRIDTQSLLVNSTVAELNNAGYEAYAITPENYVSMENLLKSDFSDIQLDPDSHYIAVIHGESGSGGVSPQATTGSSFSYTHTDGKTYTLRYLTLTSADNSNFRKGKTVNLLTSASETAIRNCLNTSVSYALSALTKYGIFGVIYSLLGVDITQIATSGDAQFNMYCGATWTRIYTQVWVPSDSLWIYGSMVEYATLSSQVNCMYYSADVNRYVTKNGITTVENVYSNYYSNLQWKASNAVNCLLTGFGTYKDITGSALFKYGSQTVCTLQENF